LPYQGFALNLASALANQYPKTHQCLGAGLLNDYFETCRNNVAKTSSTLKNAICLINGFEIPLG